MSEPQEFLSTIKTFTSCLGQGAFGIVMQAVDKSDTPSAVKFIFVSEGRDVDTDKLRREYDVTKKLQHENIVRIMNAQEKKLTSADIDNISMDLPSLAVLKFSCLQQADSDPSKAIETICIQMELCGENLRSWLNLEHDRDELHVQIRQTRIVQGMIGGLAYLHSNKIIHRDLKPDNIVFSRSQYQLPIKIGDFGLSRVIHSEESQTGSLTSRVGSRSYMAPEVNSGKYHYQADLYSLGLIMWEVAQFIEASRKRNMFDELVNDRKTILVQHHPIMAGIKDIIIGLTKRKAASRTKNLVEVNTETWEAALENAEMRCMDFESTDNRDEQDTTPQIVPISPAANPQTTVGKIIWSGLLGWNEIQRDPSEGQRTRLVRCQVSQTVAAGEPDAIGYGWPEKLTMELIPKAIVGSLGGTYFRDVKTVLFMLQKGDALTSLTRVLDSGFLGVIHFTGAGMQQQPS